jgi:hypothetical protein
MNNFDADLKFGQKYEKILIDLLPHDSYVLTCGYCKEYDFKLIVDDEEIKYEVKADRRSINTGNIFIEYECSGKPSGITTTEAKYYAYFVVKPHDLWDLYIIPTEEIKNIIDNKDFKRIVKGGDGLRSRMYIIGVKQIEQWKYTKHIVDEFNYSPMDTSD